MLTATGRLYTPENVHEALTIHEAAVGLARAARWMGNSPFPWSTLRHALVAAYAAREDQPHVQLAVLVEDVADAVLGHVPGVWRSDEERERRGAILREFCTRTLGVPVPSGEVVGAALLAAHDAEAAAAYLLGTPATWQDYALPPNEVLNHAHDVFMLPEHEAIKQYKEKLADVLGNQTVRALRSRA